MKKKRPTVTFNEEYEVKYDYQKPDGYWVFSNIETFSVPVMHGVNEKNNHNRARAKAQEELSKNGPPVVLKKRLPKSRPAPIQADLLLAEGPPPWEDEIP